MSITINGRATSANGRPFMLTTYRDTTDKYADRNTLTIWNEDESEVLVSEASAYVSMGVIHYIDPASRAHMQLILGARERAIAILYLHRLQAAGRIQMPLNY